MPLAPVVLDDLTWEEMVSSVRSRIAGASEGQWTHHAAVDPGVTLLELYSWLIEQRLYWLDQVPDELVRALLSVLGEAPRPARRAATVLALRHEAAAGFPEIEAGTVLRLTDPDAPRPFTTRNAVTVLPIARIEVEGAAAAASTDLELGRGVTLLPGGGGAAEFRILLWLKNELPTPRPAEKLGLLLELDVPAEIVPGWSPEAAAGVDPPRRAQLVVRRR